MARSHERESASPSTKSSTKAMGSPAESDPSMRRLAQRRPASRTVASGSFSVRRKIRRTERSVDPPSSRTTSWALLARRALSLMDRSHTCSAPKRLASKLGRILPERSTVS